MILRPELEAAKVLRPDAPELSRLAAAGVTSVLATPTAGLFKGQSALVNVAGTGRRAADRRRCRSAARTPDRAVAGGAARRRLAGGGRGGGYPVSLLGAIAFVRQSFLDAQHQQLEEQSTTRTKTGVRAARPTIRRSTRIQPALARARCRWRSRPSLPREILRALSMAKEFNLDPVITGAREADQVVADLKARNARVIYSLDFPTRSRALAPDADEPIRELRAACAGAEDTGRAREEPASSFAFSSDGCSSRATSSGTRRAPSRTGLPPMPRSAP